MKLFIGSFILILVSHVSAGTLVISAKTYVTGPTILLSDLGDYSVFTPEQKKKIAKISLGDAPVYGETRTFSNQAISAILRDRFSTTVLEQHQIIIPNEVQVIGAGVVVNAATVKAKLIKKLKNSCAGCDITVEDLKVNELNLPPESKWDFLTGIDGLRGSFNIGLKIDVPGQESSQQWVQGKIKIFKRVPVAARTIFYGQILVDADIQMILKDITFVQNTVADAQKIIGQRASSVISIGQILLQRNFIAENAVRAGELVTVTTGTEQWRITLKAVAQQQGSVGESIRLINPETKKLMNGIIVAKGQVEIK